MLGALPLAVIIFVFFLRIPFSLLAPPAVFVTGFIRVIIGAVEHAGVEAKVR
ncbi:hypothetical protein [Asticcacaulis solisilvae]|uniref:hypothetical protein n=1 Tax=Asticcacaulis solisilvae TaxID=1217274 RepID=UPI003FD6E54C